MTWWKHGVFYQIYPRSFMDDSGDGVGDLAGVIEKLDYVRNLGVDTIWISPIYPSPMADFGYDVSDYKDIHPLFGNLATFDRLVETAHARGMKIVLDYVPNHTSNKHPWFLEARASKDNPKRDWYIWKDAKPDGSPPNNWHSYFGGGAWEWDAATEQYYLHLFLKEQPDLNWRNPAVAEAMHDVLRFWLDRGVDGFRMDVVSYILKHKDFLDNPPGKNPDVPEHHYSINQPEVHGLIRDFRKILDEYPEDKVMIGETWVRSPAELATYYGEGMDELHIPFNFSTMRADWNAQAMRAAIEPYYAALPEDAWPNFVLGSHDESRIVTRYGVENHRSAALLLLTLRGTPTMYYGDEIGMHDVPIPREKFQDPQGINTGLSRDHERTPMQWTADPHAGFCPPEVKPWLPVPDDYKEINVEAQVNDPGSTLMFYKRLLNLRREIHALHKGHFAFIDGTPSDVLAYRRMGAGETYVTVINFGAQPQTVDLASLGERGEVVLSTLLTHRGVVDLAVLTLDPHEGVLLHV